MKINSIEIYNDDEYSNKSITEDKISETTTEISTIKPHPFTTGHDMKILFSVYKIYLHDKYMYLLHITAYCSESLGWVSGHDDIWRD